MAKLKDGLRSILPSPLYSIARQGYLRLAPGGKSSQYSLQLSTQELAQRSTDGTPSAALPDNLLEELGKKYRPTKREHGYLRHYWTHFRDIRESVKTVCEVGVQTDRSVRFWEEFFPNAQICGIDIEPACREFEGGRRRIFIGDQSDPVFLESVLSEMGGSFDILIDDGSHEVVHQLKTFEYMFPRLSPHGIYVVEDTGGCVGDTELITVNSLKALVDNIMYWPAGLPTTEWPQLESFDERASWADKNVVGIAFYRWIVFIMRGRNPEDSRYYSQMK
jgi:hypothetical protein